MKNKLIEIKTADLIPYARNAKKHDERQVSAIAGSIKEFGFNNPILVGSDNGIIAGHCRVLAAQKMGLDKVPCIILDHLTEIQRKAYILADNKLAEIGGGWDSEMLKIEIMSLTDEIDLTLAGFDDSYIEDLLDPPYPADLESEYAESDMPDYDGSPKGEGGTVIVHFLTMGARVDFSKMTGVKFSDKAKFIWFPSTPK